MAPLVYALCALTGMGCAVLLLKHWWTGRTPLLLWSGLCFACFAASNLLLFVDLVLTAESLDLSLYRTGLNLAGVLLLLYGLIWESS
jgi:hypothetical protein